jgi:hypothetical protein
MHVLLRQAGQDAVADIGEKPPPLTFPGRAFRRGMVSQNTGFSLKHSGTEQMD